MRKRWKFLGHLPLSSEFEFAEIDLRSIASKEAMAPCMGEIKKRIKKRNDKKQQEKQEKKKREESRPKGPKINPSDFPSVSKTFNEEELISLTLESQPPAVNEPMEFPSISTKDTPTVAPTSKQPASMSFADVLKPPPPLNLGPSPFLEALKKDQKQEKVPTPPPPQTGNQKKKPKKQPVFTNAPTRNYKT
jgi:hypothetical protein